MANYFPPTQRCKLLPQIDPIVISTNAQMQSYLVPNAAPFSPLGVPRDRYDIIHPGRDVFIDARNISTIVDDIYTRCRSLNVLALQQIIADKTGIVPTNRTYPGCNPAVYPLPRPGTTPRTSSNTMIFARTTEGLAIEGACLDFNCHNGDMILHDFESPTPTEADVIYSAQNKKIHIFNTWTGGHYGIANCHYGDQEHSDVLMPGAFFQNGRLYFNSWNELCIENVVSMTSNQLISSRGSTLANGSIYNCGDVFIRRMATYPDARWPDVPTQFRSLFQFALDGLIDIDDSYWSMWDANLGYGGPSWLGAIEPSGPNYPDPNPGNGRYWAPENITNAVALGYDGAWPGIWHDPQVSHLDIAPKSQVGENYCRDELAIALQAVNHSCV